MRPFFFRGSRVGASSETSNWRISPCASGIGCWLLDVRCWMFNPSPLVALDRSSLPRLKQSHAESQFCCVGNCRADHGRPGDRTVLSQRAAASAIEEDPQPHRFQIQPSDRPLQREVAPEKIVVSASAILFKRTVRPPSFPLRRSAFDVRCSMFSNELLTPPPSQLAVGYAAPAALNGVPRSPGFGLRFAS
jgi:hypothetical protein